MNPQHKAGLLKKKALDALLEMYNDPEYATHQHHSDPDFTTQNGKDYAGRNTTEPEEGLDVNIPPQDLHYSAEEVAKDMDHPLVKCSCGTILINCRCPERIHAALFPGGRPAKVMQDGCEKCKGVVQTDPKLEPPEGKEDAAFFKESDPDPEMRPVEVERKEHEFFKRSLPEYEMVRKSSMRPAYTAKKAKEFWGEPCTECNDYEQNHPNMRKPEMEPNEQFDRKEPPERRIAAEKKPKCPYCGSSDYALMPSDFETAKCSKCGKNWDHGIVPGINDPNEKTAAIKIAHKNVLDPGEYDFEHETHVREEMKQWAQYAEEKDNTEDIKPFDPSGQYLCGTCDMRRGTDDCMRVEAPISFDTGSCRLYHLGIKPETAPSMDEKFTKEEAKYSEHEGGFGCKRCEYGTAATSSDPEGRQLWCSFWGTHVVGDACCSEWDKDDEKDKLEEEARKELKTGAAKKLYHVTYTAKVPDIQKQGILPLQTSNWVKAENKERYGGGEIFAFDHPEDAIRWAAKMDWEFNKEMGSGKISIIVFKPGKEKWEIDTADPLSQGGAKGQWLKAHGAIKPEQIIKVVPVNLNMTRAVVQGKPVKLAGAQKEKFETLAHRWNPLYKGISTMGDRDVTLESCAADTFALREFAVKLIEFVEASPKGGLFDDAYIGFANVSRYITMALKRLGNVEADIKRGDKSGLDDIRSEIMIAASFLHTALHNLNAEFYYLEKDRERVTAATKAYGMDVPLDNPASAGTEFYGTGAPLGGTPNQPVPDPEEDEEEQKAAAAQEEELVAEEARIAAEVEAEDQTSIRKSASLAIKLDFSPFNIAAYKIAFADDAGWFAKSARPTPQKIELLQKQFGVTPEQIELCIAADPSPNQTDYVAWLTKWFSKGQIKLPEDTEKIKGQLGTFNKLKRSPAFTHNKDIQQYDPAKLFETLEQGQGALSEKDKDRDIIAKGSKIVVKEGDLVIYRVTDPKALSLLSGGTNWCTAQESTAGGYLKDGPSYVFFEGGSAFAQFHPASNQLMNRQDYCMVETVHEDDQSGYSTGWGRSHRYHQPTVLTKFIADPTLAAALQKLSAVEPNVAEWLKANTDDPEKAEKALAEAAKAEQKENVRRENPVYYYGEREKKWSMTIRHALASGKQLSPEIEAQMGSASTDLLFKYGTKFHAGQRWEPLEKAILKGKRTSKNIIDYAVKFVKGRWPEGEPMLLRGALLKTYGSGNMKLALEYAQRAVKGRWPELEAKFHKAKPSEASGYGSAEYAINILKQRWASIGVKPRRDGKINEEEIIIVGAPGEARRYAEVFMPGQRWAEFEQVAMGHGYLGAMIDYATQVVKGRMPELEEKILSGERDAFKRERWDRSRDLALDYSKQVLKTRWPEYEQKILEYIKNTKKENQTYTPIGASRYSYGRAGLPDTVEKYIEEVVGARWPELEQTLMSRYQEHPDQWPANQNWLDGYLFAIRGMCDRKEPKSNVPQLQDDFIDDRTSELHQTMDFETAHDQAKKEQQDAIDSKYKGNPQCEWPEGEKRLKSRDENYENLLLREVKSDGHRRYKDDSPEDQKNEWTDYKGYWVSWYGNSELEKYVDFIMSLGLSFPLGEELMAVQEDVSNRKYNRSGKNPYRKQQELQFQSSLLKKAIVDFHDAPKMLPPREQFRKHVDVEAERDVMEGVMDGVKQPINAEPLRPKPLHKQFDPNINGDPESLLMQQEIPGMPQIAAEVELLPKRTGNWKLYAWPAGTVQFGQYGEIKRPAPKGQVWYVGDKAKALPIMKENWDLSHGEENQLLERGALDLPDVILRLTNVDYYAPPMKFPPKQKKLLTGSLLEKEAGPSWRKTVLPLALGLGLTPGAPAQTPKAKPSIEQKYDPKHDPANKSRIVIEPAPESKLKTPVIHKSPSVEPRYLLRHENRFDPNVLTPEQMIQRGILRGKLDPTMKATLLKNANEQSEELPDKTQTDEDEARQAFMKQDYLLQEAQDRRCSMETLWKEVGQDYANEYFASKENRTPQNWHAQR